MRRPPRLTSLASTRAMVGVALAGVGVAVLVGIWSQSGDQSRSESDEDAAVPEMLTAGDSYPNPAEAAEARAEASDLEEARADSFVLIVADETTVHLRVRVTGSNDCRWFGVVGRVDNDVLGWTSVGPGDGYPCD